MSTQVRIQETYPFPRERVWRALTDREAIADWLMPNDFESRLGHEFEMRTRPAPGFDGIVRCMVTVLEPPSRLAFTWRGGGIDTLVNFTLESVEQGTRLTMVHSGFTGARGWMISKLLGSGWRKKILRLYLPAAVARVAETGYVPAASSRVVSCAQSAGDQGR
jgi:uncharacterized protein YndB with AHSA1/START domain